MLIVLVLCGVLSAKYQYFKYLFSTAIKSGSLFHQGYGSDGSACWLSFTLVVWSSPSLDFQYIMLLISICRLFSISNFKITLNLFPINRRMLIKDKEPNLTKLTQIDVLGVYSSLILFKSNKWVATWVT